ncbi:MAG: hypothetical protein ACRC46_06685 [Thermoguttaceae bacterium]
MAKSKSQGVSLEQIKKHAFWGVIPLVVLVSFGVTVMAVMAVSASFEKRKSELENQKKSTESIAQNQTHPNNKTIDDIKNHTQDLRRRVSDAWVTLQADQIRRSTWPANLGEDFLKTIRTKRFGDDIAHPLREIYRGFINKALPAMEVTAQRRRLMLKVGKATGGWREIDPATGLPTGRSCREDEVTLDPSDPTKKSGWTEADKQRSTMGMIDTLSGGMSGGMTGGSSMSGGGGMGRPPGGGGMGSPRPSSSGGMGSSRPPGGGGMGSTSMGSGGSTMGGGAGAGGNMNDVVTNQYEKWEGIVDWDAPEIYGVRSGWDLSQPPTPKEIWYAQEDLWVYDALISVVVKSNAGATGPHNAKIKRIEGILIGQAASFAVAEQFMKSLNMSMGAGGMGMGGGPGGMGMGGSGPGGMGMGGSSGPGGMGMGGSGPGGMGGATAAATAKESRDAIETRILDYRYIDLKGQPLLASDTPPFPQFKRMPVVLRLVVDQRYIPDILVNCANCPMPIDVFFVKYNSPEAPSFDLSQHLGTASMGGSMGGMGGSSSGPPMGGGGGGGGMSARSPSMVSSSRGSGGGSSASGTGGRAGAGGMGGAPDGSGQGAQFDGTVGIYGPESIPIEIYGVVNIFNPPDDSLNETEDAEAGTGTSSK